jgi:muramidase (phage lysozyme)
MPRLALVKPVAAFLDLIAHSEGTSTSKNTRDDGYDIIVSGVDGPHTFSDYSAHPFAAGRAPIIVRAAPALLKSTASGRYQITLPTWRSLCELNTLGTFSPENQDLAAIDLLRQCHAYELITASKIAAAIEACCETWASFAGNNYGQGGRTLAWLQEEYTSLLAAEQ